MSFLHGQWKVLKEKKALEAKYGDNAPALLRAGRLTLAPKGHIFANNHLLNKNFKVVPWQQKLKEVK